MQYIICVTESLSLKYICLHQFFSFEHHTIDSKFKAFNLEMSFLKNKNKKSNAESLTGAHSIFIKIPI